MKIKNCVRCNAKFESHGSGKRCLECRKFHKSKQGMREYQFKYAYGIEWPEYQRMLDSQNGCCKICGTKDSHCQWSNGRFFVDHCHETGKVRGLLCANCNQGLGKFFDNQDLLRKAIEYLRS
jgi:hypothetical protein